LHTIFLIFIIHKLKGERIVNKSEYTTYLIRNIPRKEWKKIRMLCIDKGVKVNDLMLDIVNKVSTDKLIGKTILQKAENNVK
tara:strand:+ start:348 stop:593 length:246 start_codon:yes stop_codon:yes gene_type:complete